MSRKSRKPKRSFRMIRDRRRVAILTPCDDRVATEYATSLVEMVQYTYNHMPSNLEALAIQCFGSSILPYSRETLARYALQVKATHTLWIDSDMRFPRDMLVRFLASNESIVGINAMSRREPYRNCAQVRPDEPLETNAESTGYEKVHRMGFGVVWVATRVFESIPEPWFDFEYVPDQRVWRGEDFGFFERARDLGIPFYVDHDLSKEVYHMGAFGFNPLMMAQVLQGRESQGGDT